MRDNPLWHVSVVTSAEAEEAVRALLERLFRQPVAIYIDEKTKTATASTFLANLPPDSKRVRIKLWRGLQRIGAFGLKTEPGMTRIRRVPRTDWAESWKRHFKPFEIDRSLLIKPSWSSRQPRKGQAVVVLDPGLSFGTGQHPTTRFCLEQLVACRKPGIDQALLDAGTGSGILAIAAAKLGYRPVRAFDFDPAAVRTANANARRNAVQARVTISRHDLARLPVRSRRKFDVICANLTSDLLLRESTRFLNRLTKRGTLILAGITARQFGDVKEVYSASGLRLKASHAEGEWRSGAFACRQ